MRTPQECAWIALIAAQKFTSLSQMFPFHRHNPKHPLNQPEILHLQTRILTAH